MKIKKSFIFAEKFRKFCAILGLFLYFLNTSLIEKMGNFGRKMGSKNGRGKVFGKVFCCYLFFNI